MTTRRSSADWRRSTRPRDSRAVTILVIAGVETCSIPANADTDRALPDTQLTLI